MSFLDQPLVMNQRLSLVHPGESNSWEIIRITMVAMSWEVAVEQGICVAVRPRDDRMVRGVSQVGETLFEHSLDHLDTSPESSNWSRYPLGVLWAIQEHGLSFAHGFDLAIVSNVPSGAGMSSSAALELATAYATLDGTSHKFSRKDIVKICQYSENHYVGVPCGNSRPRRFGFWEKRSSRFYRL